METNFANIGAVLCLVLLWFCFGSILVPQAEETEANFANIGDAILLHLKPSEVPTARALALDVAQTFVQNVLRERSKDRKSSKVSR